MPPVKRAKHRHHTEERQSEILPREILLQIIADLSITDLKSVRLCNKFLAQNAAGRLFRTLIVLFTQEHFDRLQHVADHPILHNYVRCIVYAGNRLHSGPPKLRRKLRENRKSTLQNVPNKYEKIKKGYEQISHEQAELTRRCHDLFVWKTTILKFPNLEDIKVLMLESFKGDKGLLKPITDNNLSVSVADFELDFESSYGGSNYQPMGIRQTLGILCPLLGPRTGFSGSSVQLKTLCLAGVSWKAFTMLHNLTANFATVFSSLENLEIKYLIYRENQRHGHESANKSRETIRLLVKSAPRLKTVKVARRKMDRTHGPGSVFDPNFRLENVFDPHMSWPNLSDVDIRGIRCHLDTLNAFISRHKDSLRKLELVSSLCMTRPAFQDWESYVEYLGSMNPVQIGSDRGFDKEFTCKWGPEPLYEGAHITFFGFAGNSIVQWLRD